MRLAALAKLASHPSCEERGKDGAARRSEWDTAATGIPAQCTMILSVL
jgi:hypothetical protein